MYLGTRCRQLLSATSLLCSPRRIFSASPPTTDPGGSYRRSMASFTTLRRGDTVTVSPKNEAEQSGLVVICHGLGDTAEGFVDVAQHLATALPHLKFILPTAPTQPVTMNGGMPMPSWYDITGLDERSNENCAGIDRAQTTVKEILAQEHASTGLPYRRMVLAGFSQGGALSLFTGLQLEHKLGGIVVMSGYLPAAAQFQITPGLEDTSILHCHGEADPMVVVDVAKKSQDVVLSKGAASYDLKTYPGLVHSVSIEEIADVQEFLKNILPLDAACRVTLQEPADMSVKELRAAVRAAGLGSKAMGFMEKSEFVKLIQNHRAGKL